MSGVKAKFILGAALAIQMIGICTLLVSDFSGPAANIAFWVVVSAGFVEVALALRTKRQNDALNG